MKRIHQYVLSLMLLLLATLGAAEELKVGKGPGGIEVPLYPGKPYIHVMFEGRSVRVQRVQDPDYELKGYYAKTIRKCPPHCLQPERVAPGVETVGEIEVFKFMEKQLRDGDGILIDARLPSWYRRGTIPGAVNYPFTLFADKTDSDPEVSRIFKIFGVKPRGDVGAIRRKLEEWGLVDPGLVNAHWDFNQAKDLLLFCNGPACGQSPRAIHALIKLGYPASKLHYYRGGMQLWELWGLTTVVPTQGE